MDGTEGCLCCHTLKLQHEVCHMSRSDPHGHMVTLARCFPFCISVLCFFWGGIIQCSDGEGDGFALGPFTSKTSVCTASGQASSFDQKSSVVRARGLWQLLPSQCSELRRCHSVRACVCVPCNFEMRLTLAPQSFQFLRRAGWLRYQSSDPGRSPLLWQVS